MDQKFSFDTIIFDLDGVITKTALVHAAAWKEMFDEFLLKREKEGGDPFKAFTHEGDYLPYVDGKPRQVGIQSFLESRGIELPLGEVEDPPEKETVYGLGNRKNIKFRHVLETKGVEVYRPAIDLVKDLKSKGIRIGMASSSKNCQFVLQTVGIEELFETRVDGVVSAEMGLKGKPEGDIFVQATKNLGSEPSRAIVVEDAISGVQAGANGSFGLVLGVAREGNAAALKENGADVVVESFEGVTTETVDEWFTTKNK